MTHPSTKPLLISVTRHPYLPGRWTHLVSREHARSRGWLTTGNLPLGTWRSRDAAMRWARKLVDRNAAALLEERP